MEQAARDAIEDRFFGVVACGEVEKITEGEHERFIVSMDKFLDKIKMKQVK